MEDIPQATPYGGGNEPLTLDALQAQRDEERKKSEAYLGSWQRTAADFANYKRRTEQERADNAKFASAMLILNLLPVADDLERALANLPRELAGLTWIEGVVLIHRKLASTLENEGVQPITTIGEAFDPALHEAVMQGPGPEGKVIAEFQKGYTLNGRVIRPAMVKVGAGGQAEGEST